MLLTLRSIALLSAYVLITSLISYPDSFDLFRHGIYFTALSFLLLLIYYLSLFLYFKLHIKENSILPDAYNIYLLLFSFLVLPGVVTYSIVSNSPPSIAYTVAGIIFLLPGVYSEVSLQSISKKFRSVSYTRRIPTSNAKFFLGICILLFALPIALGQLNSSGALTVIYGLFNDSTGLNSTQVNEFRSVLYQEGGGFTRVISNYAVGIIGILFVLPTSSYFWKRHSSSISVLLLSKFTASTLLIFPLIYSIGTGSRLQLMKLILVYLVYYLLPKGLALKKFPYLSIVVVVFTILIATTSMLGRGLYADSFGENVVIQAEKSLARLIFKKGLATMQVYNVYPQYEEFEGIGPFFTQLIPNSTERSDDKIANKMFRYYRGGDGSAGPQSIGHSYALFGQHVESFVAATLSILLLILRKFYSNNLIKNDFDRSFWTLFFISFGYMGYSDLAAFKTSGAIYVALIYFATKLLIKSFSKPLTSHV